MKGLFWLLVTLPVAAVLVQWIVLDDFVGLLLLGFGLVWLGIRMLRMIDEDRHK